MAGLWTTLMRRGVDGRRTVGPPTTLAEVASRSTADEQADADEHTAAGLPDQPPQVPELPTDQRTTPARDAPADEGGSSDADGGPGGLDAAVVPPPGLQPAERPLILGRRRSVVATALMFSLGAGLAYVLFLAVTRLYTVIVMVALALLIALTLNPLVELLQRRGSPRWLAAVLAWVLAAVVLATPVVLAVRAASNQLPGVINNVPSLLNNAENHLGSVGDRLRSVTSGGSGASVSPDRIVTYLLQGGQVVFDAVSGIVVVGLLTLWMLIALPRLVEFLLLLVPATHRPATRQVTTEILTLISRQMITSVAIAILAGLATFGWTAIFGIPYPILLGSLVAVLDLVPTIGSTIGGAIVTLIALTVSLPTAIFTLAFYIGFRMVEDYVILPRAMRFSVELPGVVTVPAVLVGGAVLGLPGAFFAVPITLVIRVLVRDLALPALDKR